MRAVLIAVIAALVLAPGGDALATQHHQKKHHHHARKHRAKPKPPPQAPMRPSSFDGTCEFSGAVQFNPPMTSTPQKTAQHANAPGTCTGTFIDGVGASHELSGAAASYTAQSSGDQVSCAFGLASGSGTLNFPDGAIGFTMHEYRAAALPFIRLDGKAGGGAWMPVTPSQDSDPVAAVQACNGAGLSEFKLDAHLRTDGAISG